MRITFDYNVHKCNSALCKVIGLFQLLHIDCFLFPTSNKKLKRLLSLYYVTSKYINMFSTDVISKKFYLNWLMKTIISIQIEWEKTRFNRIETCFNLICNVHVNMNNLLSYQKEKIRPKNLHVTWNIRLPKYNLLSIVRFLWKMLYDITTKYLCL